MSHAYPISKTARLALTKAESAARTRAEAEQIAAPETIAALETEWLTIKSDELSDLLQGADDGPGHGFLQTYEDASGNRVLAVTYWKLKSKTTPKKPEPVEAPQPKDDHTDDLYFKHRKSKRRKKVPVNPDQLNLFGSSDDS